MKLINKRYNDNLTQNYNSVHFIMLDNNFKTLHKPFMCKDYFQDIYWGERIYRGNFLKYGFKFKPDNYPVNDRYINLCFGPSRDDITFTRHQYKTTVRVLNYFEKQLRFKNKTKILGFKKLKTKSKLEFKDKLLDNCVIKYTNEWGDKPYLLSLMFLLLRESFNFTGSYEYDNIIKHLSNKLYFKTIVPALDRIILRKNLYDKFYNSYWDSFKDVDNVHNDSGILSLAYKII